MVAQGSLNSCDPKHCLVCAILTTVHVNSVSPGHSFRQRGLSSCCCYEKNPPERVCFQIKQLLNSIQGNVTVIVCWLAVVYLHFAPVTAQCTSISLLQWGQSSLLPLRCERNGSKKSTGFLSQAGHVASLTAAPLIIIVIDIALLAPPS